MRHLTVRSEEWPLRQVFTISRGARTTATVVVVEISEGEWTGRGECVPYARYEESVPGVIAEIEALAAAIGAGLDREELQHRLPPGAARNAVDCALWDLEAKTSSTPVWQLARLPKPTPILSAFTISLDEPEHMGRAARAESERPILKLKLAGSGDVERVRAVRAAAPRARIIADANEAWTPALFAELSPQLADLGVAMIEQPLPAGRDAALAELGHPVPVCADESCHTSDDVASVADRYDVVNLKLDKAGGLTEAKRFAAAASQADVDLMLGCMMCTSLGIAPAMLLATTARFVDLDAPLWLTRDRPHGLEFDGSEVSPPDPRLWG